MGTQAVELSWLALGLGVVLALTAYVCLSATIRIRRRTKHWVATEGVVIGHRTVKTGATNSDGIQEEMKLRFCRYRFTDPTGKVREGTGGSARSPKGSTITVRYDPDRPSDHQTEGASRMVSLMAVGLIVAIPAAVLLVLWGLAGVLGFDPVIG